MEKFDTSEGKWRTVGGRRIFIRDGEDLASAMKRSGKFKGLSDAAIKSSIKVNHDDEKLEAARKEKNEEKFSQKDLDNVWKKEDATEIYDTLTEREKTKLAQAHDDADNFNNQSAKDYIKKMDNEAAKRYLERKSKTNDEEGSKPKSDSLSKAESNIARYEKEAAAVKSQVNGIEQATGSKVKNAFETDLFGNGKEHRFILKDGTIVGHTLEAFGEKRDDWYVGDKNFKNYDDVKKYLSGGSEKSSNNDNKSIKQLNNEMLGDKYKGKGDTPSLIYSNNRRIDIANNEAGGKTATVWKDGKIERKTNLPENVKGDKTKDYFDYYLKKLDNDTNKSNTAYKNAFEEYKKKHPNSKLTLQKFIDMSEGK